MDKMDRYKDEKYQEREFYRVMKKYGVESPEELMRQKKLSPFVKKIILGASVALVTGTFFAYQWLSNPKVDRDCLHLKDICYNKSKMNEDLKFEFQMNVIKCSKDHIEIACQNAEKTFKQINEPIFEFNKCIDTLPQCKHLRINFFK